MKFQLGYQLPREGSEPFVEIVRDYLRLGRLAQRPRAAS